ncbi:MAG TPA: dephospho-CoA kinase [Terriglobales bacterium]|nr:dephospho-CoA kinase [Terriglobales bacterium]
MSLKVGLTGGVACGKTCVADMFARRGAHVIQADKIAHQLMTKGGPVFEAILKTFGPEIVADDGTISRPKLADAAFDSGRIAELNAIVHPAVIAAENEWMRVVTENDPSAVAIVEAALLFEAHAEKRYDKLITVTCTFGQKVERFAARHKLAAAVARAEVERRMKAQFSDEQKVRAADYVVDNSGPLSETEKQVDKIWPELQRLALATS